MTLRFGTDGVRGVANTELTPELVLALGRAAARVFPGDRLVIGRDTRISGSLIENSLAAGMASEGWNVGIVGVVPTPHLAWISQQQNVAAAMISASHNPFADNGIKFFLPGGLKLSDEIERSLEFELDRLLKDAESRNVHGERVGNISAVTDADSGFEFHLVDSISGRDLSGLSVVLDCAHGAAFAIAPKVFRRLGAEVAVIHASPNGVNINASSGSTHPEQLQREVVRLGADLGLAFDGDADRMLAVDAKGALIDGDHLIAILAKDRHSTGRLAGGAVVVTVMTNLGFRLAMEREEIRVIETAVGDRYVIEALDRDGLSLGGEQSGHVIFRDLATTGDGVLTGIQLCDTVKRSGRSLGDLAADSMTRLPQVLRSVKLPFKGFDVMPALAQAISEAEFTMAGRGRILVRPSGTEPVVRVMVEAPSESLAAEICGQLCDLAIVAASKAVVTETPKVGS